MVKPEPNTCMNHQGDSLFSSTVPTPPRSASLHAGTFSKCKTSRATGDLPEQKLWKVEPKDMFEQISG